MREEVDLWIRKGQEDYKTAVILFDNARYEDCAVYCHQAAEKALKSLYLLRHDTVPKVHDITHLARKLELPRVMLEFCIKITPAYFAGRYPDAPGYDENLFTKEECAKFVKMAGELLEWIKKIL